MPLKLLIITQKVDRNDSVLGFMHTWIEAFSKQVDELTVICLQKGEYHFAENVKVLSLGKEEGKGRIIYLSRLFRYVVTERHRYDHVWVHMNQEYIVLAGLLWKLMGKQIGLWYAHGHVPFSLKVAEKLTNHIFTSGQSGFRLKTGKLHVVGQGIDVDAFVPRQQLTIRQDSFSLITIGRISPVKDYETLIEAVSLLRKQYRNVAARIVGGAGLAEQEHYFSTLKELVKEKELQKYIEFTGPIANKDILPYLHDADVFVNMSHTGSLDKAVLEAMSAGLPVVTCNEAYTPILQSYADRLLYEKKNPQALVQRIVALMDVSPEKRQTIGHDLRTIVATDHSLKSFVNKILSFYHA